MEREAVAKEKNRADPMQAVGFEKWMDGAKTALFT
jgi:hypothetical protein